MQAVRVRALGSIDLGELQQIDVPTPAPDEVMIDVHAAPVNLVDVITVTGKYQFHPDPPYTPGKGPAGVVRAVGSSVQDVKVGDRVLAMCEKGGYAECAVAPARNVYRLPDEVPLEAAAAMSVSYETAYLALTDRAQIRSGESVLVLGAGSAVGSATLQIARALGAGPIIAAVRDVSSADRLREQGATAIISLAGDHLRDDVRAQVFPLTEGRGADVVVDLVGGDAFDGAIRCVAWRGRAVIIGFASGRIPQLGMNYPLLKNLSVSGLQISDYRDKAPHITRACINEIMRMHAAGEITHPPVKAYELAQWKVAMHAVLNREYPQDRVILTPLG